MNFDPQKFFIGLMDFFSILLPGALLTYLLMDEIGPSVLPAGRYEKLEDGEAWAVFLLTSYVAGHIVFLLGSWLDHVYDWLRGYTLDRQVVLLARRGKLLSWPIRALVWLVFKEERNLAVSRARAIKEQMLGPLKAKDAINTFQWCKALLAKESTESLATVQRFEADSKFFRCFTIVLLVLLLTWPFHQKWPTAVIPVVLVLLLLALWRYMDQRYKATNQAYWSIITLTGNQGKVSLNKDSSDMGSPSCAGGVVYRVRGGEVEYLLVEAKNDPNQWVLSKGHVEAGESDREAAVREVHEETGVWARIVKDLDVVTWSVDGSVVITRFFLMNAVGRGLRKEKDRQHRWLPLQDAIGKASRNETRELLQTAEQRRLREMGLATDASGASSTSE